MRTFKKKRTQIINNAPQKTLALFTRSTSSKTARSHRLAKKLEFRADTSQKGWPRFVWGREDKIECQIRNRSGHYLTMVPTELVRCCKVLVYTGNGTIHHHFLDGVASKLNIILEK
jgi:hypothetical protein